MSVGRHYGNIANQVLPAEETWSTDVSLPFFDNRLVVDTSAHFVASSFQVRTARGEPSGAQSPKRSPVADRDIDRGTGSGAGMARPHGGRGIHLLQVLTSQAHGFAGAERLALELVPRCRALKEQLYQTVHPLCTDAAYHTAQTNAMTTAITYEVNRFLRARLVSVDLAELIEFDCFADVGPDDKVIRRRASQGSMAKLTRTDSESEDEKVVPNQPMFIGSRVAQDMVQDANGFSAFPMAGVGRTVGTIGLHPGTFASVGAPMGSHRGAPLAPSKEDPEAREELVVKRFELRFWRAFANGLGRSLFGPERHTLIERFEASAQDVYDRYEGELQLAVNSLMGWLPSWISDSLFIAFVGLPASVAVRQRAQKYTMLHRCVRTLMQASGRYIFVSTPGWYLPLVSWLPGLGRKEQVRTVPGQLSIGLRMVWPYLCLDPQEVIEIVDRTWGGRIHGQRARLQLYHGVEPMGPWLLRATVGCERLFVQALKAIQECAPIFEQAYDDMVEDGIFGKVFLPVDSDMARGVAQETAQAITKYAFHRRRTTIRRKSTDEEEHALISQVMPARRRSSLTRLGITRFSLAETPVQRRRSSFLRTASSRHLSTGAADRAVELVWAESDGEGETPGSLLARLHEDSHGLTVTSASESGACRLRKAVFAGGMAVVGGMEEPLSWPIGEGSSGGRIPIHESPDLLPTSAPPIELQGDEFLLPSAAGAWDLSSTGRSKGMGTTSSLRSRQTGTQLSAEPIEEVRPSFHLLGTSPPDPDNAAARWGRRARSEPRVREPKLHPSAEEVPKVSLRRLREAAAVADAPASPGSGGRRGSSRRGPLLRKRTKSSPPALDTREFDAGDPHRNTAVALALQEEVRRLIAVGCAEGPLRIAWRNIRADEGTLLVLRTRYSLGILLFFMAARAPLPTWAELPLHYFMDIGEGVIEERDTLPPPTVPVPDGVYAMGCVPIFNTMATGSSARTAPITAGAFRVGVPRVLMEPTVIRDALLDRRIPTALRWSGGSMLVLLAAAAFTEAERPSSLWYERHNWMRQEHRCFAQQVCVFRIILGLEYVSMWHDRRLTQVRTTLVDLLPFIKSGKPHAAGLSVRMDPSASDGQYPLLSAPWVSTSLQGTPGFDPTLAEWTQDHLPGGKAVPLQDFAAWVTSLAPGRAVYSSPYSPTGDLYLRLQDNIIVLGFACISTLAPPLETYDIHRMYTDAVGEAAWWGRNFVTYILLCNKLTKPVETACGNASCLLLDEEADVPGCEDIKVMPGTEVIICHQNCLGILLGPMNNPITTHQHLFEAEVKENPFQYQPKPRGSTAPGTPARGRTPAGNARNAADWCSKRPQAPKHSLLDLNLEILRCLLDHVSTHTEALAKQADVLNEGSNSGSVALLAERNAEAKVEYTLGDDTPSHLSLANAKTALAAAESKREQEKLAAREILFSGRSPPVERFPRGLVAGIDPREESPVRTEKSRSWRPPTPHPQQAPDQARRQLRRNEFEMRPEQPGALEEVVVDYLGLGDWKVVDIEDVRPRPVKRPGAKLP